MKKRTFKKLLFKGMVALGFAFILLVGFILTPSVSYAHQTEVEGLLIHHDEKLSPKLGEIIQQSFSILKRSALYDPHFQMELCMNDGPFYPKLIEGLLGPDIIRAFSNKNVVLLPTTESGEAFSWHGNTFNYTQVLAHVMTHNLQYNYHGFWDANPLGRHPEWKWEGYAEYVVLGEKYKLEDLLEKYSTSGEDLFSFISLGERAGTFKLHIRYLILTKYCLENKNMDYQKFIETDLVEEELWEEIEQLSSR